MSEERELGRKSDKIVVAEAEIGEKGEREEGRGGKGGDGVV